MNNFLKRAVFYSAAFSGLFFLFSSINYEEPGIYAGTASFITSDGYLVTARHLTHNKQNLRILFKGKEIPVKVIKEDPRDDIAIVKASVTGVKYLSVEPAFNTGSVQLYGFPKGISLQISRGTGYNQGGYIQLNAWAEPGFSGGPIIHNNEIVGIISGGPSANGSYNGWGPTSYEIKQFTAKLHINTTSTEHDAPGSSTVVLILGDVR